MTTYASPGIMVPSPRVPVRQRLPGWAVGLYVIFAVGGLVVVVLALAPILADAWARAALATAGVVALLLPCLPVALSGSLRPGRLAVSTSAPLQLVPPRARLVATVVGTPLLIAPGALVVLAWSTGHPITSLGLLPTVFLGAAVVGVVGAVRLIAGLRIPRGLTMSPTGLTGVRDLGPIRIDWEDLATARATVVRGAFPGLQLVARRGDVRTIPAALFGSDPNVVAAVVLWFLEHPEDRPLLADGARALDAIPRRP